MVISLVQVTPLGSSETRTHTRKMSRWGFCGNLDARSSQGDNKSCCKNIKWPCSRYTVLIGWTGSRGWTGNIQDDDRFLSKSITRLWPLWDISLTAYYCSFLYKKCLACRYNLFFGWRRCTGKMGTILDDSIYFGRGITRWSWPLIWTPIQLYTH